MTYRYKVYTQDKRLIHGTIESDSIEKAETSLYKAGYKRILNIQKTGSSLDIQKLFSSSPKISKEVLLDFTSELTVLAESGLTLLSALKQLEKQTGNAALKDVLNKVVEDLKGGMAFHKALSLHPKVFSETYCSMMEANEKAGTMDAGLRQLAKQMKQEIATRSQIMRSITQPAIILGMAIIVVFILVTVALPPFVDLFKQFNTQLPLTTRLLIGFADFIKNFKYAILGVLMMAVALIMIFLKQPSSELLIHRLSLRIPLIGEIINWNNTAQFSRALSNLLGAGILLPDAMNIVLRGISNTFFRESLNVVRKQIVQGQSLSETLSKNQLFPSLLVEMVGVGETSGNLESSLGTVADYYEAKVEKRVTRLTSLLEPALTLVLGLVVGFIAISVISTIYTLTGSFK